METEIVCDPKYGYLRIDPIPTQEELSKYYREVYFKSVEKGNKAQEIQRQKIGGEEARLELEWLNKTLYKDIIDYLSVYVESRDLLDVGSGTGAFLKYARSRYWDVEGIEPSDEGNKMAKVSDLLIHNISLDDYARTYGTLGAFGSVTLLNVLEHVLDPATVLLTAKKLLKPDGVICIRVPNDFSILQECAEKKLGKRQWWVITPDHINYFNFESLQKLIESVGFYVIYRTTDFPMELFLLMGDDYVGNPEVGSDCHGKRRNFELSIPDEVRRNIYSRLATIGVGRSCIVFARAK